MTTKSSSWGWKPMETILENAQKGDFKLERFYVEPSYAAFRLGVMPGTYIRLLQKNCCGQEEVVMSNTNMEKRTNMDFVNNAHGDVLIGGLGIGMVVLAAQDKSEVQSITVVEKHQEVIDIVASQLPLNGKVSIILGDVETYVPEKRFNCIYLDIWNYINRDIYEMSMYPLRMRYRKFLVSKGQDPHRYIDCWAYVNARDDIPLF